MDLQVFQYNDQPVSRNSEGYINLTQMCKANGKRLDVFMKTKQTQEYISELERSHQSEVAVSEIGGITGGGTWGHPALAIRLAQWISPKFAVWCDAHIFNLMATGKTTIEINPIEEMQLRIELTRMQVREKEVESELLSKRKLIVDTCPEHVQQKILGYTEVEKVVVRDRVIDNGRVIAEGNDLTKGALCKRYGFINKSGGANTKRLNAHLTDLGMSDSNEDFWKTSLVARTCKLFKAERLAELDRQLLRNDRQRYLGEQ